jgi:rare lipoprotein A
MIQRIVLCCAVMSVGSFLLGCGAKHVVKPSLTQPQSGGYYKDDGPAQTNPVELDKIPDAELRDEPLHRFANRPYNVFGVDYTPMTQRSPFAQRGVASWYGRKFHGQKTAIGETYDMFAMTAAHPTAPLPSYAQVTHTRSGKSVIVRINDRGPFLHGRIVDLSYAAAHRIGIVQAGSGEVTLELLLPPYNLTSRASTRPAFDTPTPQMPPPAPIPVQTTTSAPAGTQFFVQLGAFGNFANAQVFQQRMTLELNNPPLVKQVGGLFRVQLGPFGTMADAQAARDAAQLRMNTGLPIITAPSQ